MDSGHFRKGNPYTKNHQIGQKALGFSVKVLQKGVIKVLRPIWLSETRGGGSGAPNLATPPPYSGAPGSGGFIAQGGGGWLRNRRYC